MRWASFLVIILIAGCDQNRMFEQNRAFDNETWSAKEPAVFKVPVQDTVNPHRFFLTLRNSGQYPYSNLFVFLTTIYPDSTVSADTFEVILSDPSGRWLGKGSGGIYEHRILFRNNVVFPDTGTYTFSMVHGMRTAELPNILDAGLRIERQ